MSQRLALVCGIAVVAAGAPSFAAVAAVEPLLVVVETAPGVAVDPVDVRRAIAGELGAPVRGLRDAEAPDTSDLLIVVVDRDEIRMSLRAGAAGVVSRAVPTPGDRKGRLQSIGWLAGNLARDQVSGIVVPVSAEGESALRPESPPAAPRPETEPPPAAPRPETEPPPLAEAAARATTGASGGIVSARPASTEGGAGATWSVTLAGGPSAFFHSPSRGPDQDVWPGPGLYYLEVQRKASANGLILGATVDVGPDLGFFGGGSGLDLIAGAALVGVGRRFSRAFVEATAGLGLEVYQGTANVMAESGSYGIPTLSLGLFVRGQAAAGLALSKSFDLVASVGGHLGTVGRGDQFLASSLGLRVRFQ